MTRSFRKPNDFREIGHPGGMPVRPTAVCGANVLPATPLHAILAPFTNHFGGIGMKRVVMATGMALFISACSVDEESKVKLEKAAEHAKQAAREVGEVISTTTSEARDKWGEMNADRIEETPKENPELPEHKVDTTDLKNRLKAAKDAFFSEPGEGADRASQDAGGAKKEG